MVPVRSPVGTTLAYTAVYAVATVVGLLLRQGHDEGAGLILYFWPAVGVAALWMLHGRTRAAVLLDATLLFATSTIVDALMGFPLAAAAAFGLANLVCGVTVRAVSAHVEAQPFWGRLPRRVAGKRDLAQLGTAAVAASVASTPIRWLGAYAHTGTVDWHTAAASFTRTACSTFVVVAAVLALLTALLRSHARHGWAARIVPDPRNHWGAELVLGLTIAVGSAAYLFSSTHALPIAYLLIVPATWLGYRFSPVVCGSYALFLTPLGVLCTQAGRGPFASIEDHATRAMTVQVYVLVIAVLLLVLSLGVGERSSLLARVLESENRATSRAEQLDAIMNAIRDGLVVFNPAGEVVMSNHAADALVGNRGPLGSTGTPADHGFFRPDGTPLATHQMPHARALQGEVITAEDLLHIDPDTGHQTTLSVSAAPMTHSAPDGEPLAVLVTHDVTKERSHRRELQAFAATVAHDLKTPLTGVRSWAEILGDDLDALGVDVTEPRSSLRRIESSALRMQQLIGDLLAYSQAQSAELKPTSLSLTALVDNVAREVRENSAGAAALVEHGPLGRVLADKTLVNQLLANVIGNAVKYVAPGTRPRVVVTTEVVEDMLEVRVADNGIGIPRSERGRIFESFYRASSSGSYPGTGLGLAICARAVERHGGRISAREGLDGAGTTIVFTLPADLAPAPEPTDDPTGAAQRRGRTTSAEPPPRRTGSETAVT